MSIPAFTVAQLIDEVRINIKGTNAYQYTDATILNYINIFFVQDMPQEIQLLSYKTWYRFVTLANVDKYVFPQNQYTGIFGQVFVRGIPVTTYQDPDLFALAWVLNNFVTTAAIGSGASTYTFLIPFPSVRGYTDFLGTIYPGVYISAASDQYNNMTVTDNGVGVLLNSSSIACGTINYLTGQVTVSFPSPVPSGTQIYANTQTYQAGQPSACLYYNQTFTLRTVPDKAYVVGVAAYVNPAAYANTSQPVIINSMFKYIAYGTARYMLLELKDLSQLEVLDQLYKEQERMLLRISTRQRMQGRIPTIFNTGMNGAVFGSQVPYTSSS